MFCRLRTRFAKRVLEISESRNGNGHTAIAYVTDKFEPYAICTVLDTRDGRLLEIPPREDFAIIRDAIEKLCGAIASREEATLPADKMIAAFAYTATETRREAQREGRASTRAHSGCFHMKVRLCDDVCCAGESWVLPAASAGLIAVEETKRRYEPAEYAFGSERNPLKRWEDVERCLERDCHWK